jgi:hypothetical protein
VYEGQNNLKIGINWISSGTIRPIAWRLASAMPMNLIWGDGTKPYLSKATLHSGGFVPGKSFGPNWEASDYISYATVEQ